VPNCCICTRDFVNGKSFTLTPEEQKVLGPNVKEVHYCAACLRVSVDRESGAQLLKGLYEMRLRELGVPRAKELSEEFYTKLLRATAKKMH
jgi:hypothetical protein